MDGEPLQNHETGTHSNGSRENRYLSQMGSFVPLKDKERGPELVIKSEEGILWDLCMPVVQDGNQRCAGPPYGHTGRRPIEECEVYGGQLPRDVYEDRIFGVFSRYGSIFRIRITTKPDGTSRGYFHVHYYRKEAAELAASELNGFKFSTDEGGIRLKQLTQIKKLFISGIPIGLTIKDVYEALLGTRCAQGLTGVDLPLVRSNVNRGFCFLGFKDHMSALVAWQWISHLKPFKSDKVVVSWAIPQTPKVEGPEVQEAQPRTIPFPSP